MSGSSISTMWLQDGTEIGGAMKHVEISRTILLGRITENDLLKNWVVLDVR